VVKQKQKKQLHKKSSDIEGVLTKKLDSLLKEAKIDGALVKSLGDSIRNFKFNCI